MLTPGISMRGGNNEKELMLRDNVVIPRDEALVVGKNAYNLKSNKNYRNNELLLQQLQPVPVKPAVTLDQGTVFLICTLLAYQPRPLIYGCDSQMSQWIWMN